MRQDRLLNDFIAHLESLFSITKSDARKIIAHFHEEMRRGLAGENSSLKMIPSFVRRPTGTERGNFLALDLGGTNIRVLSVALDGRGHAMTQAVSRFVIPGEVMRGRGDALFDFIAGSVASFFEEHDLADHHRYDLAFTFSFPVAQSSVATGTLIGWTKGFTASGVEGADVAALLSKAMKRKGLDFVRVAALTNDTVGTLVAGCYADPSCDMGVILGTGTNACYPEKIARIPKYLGPGTSGEMIVNMEWGNFNGLTENRYDAMLDAASPNAGRQQLEKMVSGLYLGEIARLVIRELMEKGLLCAGADRFALSEPYALTTEDLSLMAHGHDDFFSGPGFADISHADRAAIREIGRLVAGRSARIAGAAIVAVLTWVDADLEADHTVAIDGSLFEKNPEYEFLIMDTLRDLCGDRAAGIKLVLARDGSGIGSAIVGAVASMAERNDSPSI
jgi:hexokinase